MIYQRENIVVLQLKVMDYYDLIPTFMFVMVDGKCENKTPLLWGIHQSVLWSGSYRAQPGYLINFYRLLLF